nr:hypothetical protein [uncultured Marinifilum sp.]
MDNKLYNTIQELGRSIQSAQEAAKRQCTSSSINPQIAFQSELDYKMQQYVHQMHTYLNIDRVLGFPIQPMGYSSETNVSDRGVKIRVAIHHYPPVKPMIIESPEMILELRAMVDTNGRMEYQLSNYFASPEDLKALAPHLPEGSCLILLEDGSLSVEEMEETGIGFSGGFSLPNISKMGENASNGEDAQTLFFLGLGLSSDATEGMANLFQLSNMEVKAAAIRNNLPTGKIDKIMGNTSRFAIGAKWVGRGAIVGGTIISIYQGYNAYSNGDIRGVEKAGLDLGVGLATAAIGGIPGLVLYGVYMLMMQPVPQGTGYQQPNVCARDNTYMAPPVMPIN